MFNVNYRPNPYNFRMFGFAEYRDVRYSYRQKMRQFEHLISNLNHISRLHYVLYLGSQDCALVDTINNKIICTVNYSDSPVCLLQHFDNLYRYWKYETSFKPRNLVENNDYRTLSQKYNYVRQN